MLKIEKAQLYPVLLGHSEAKPCSKILLCADRRFDDLPVLKRNGRYLFSAGAGLASSVAHENEMFVNMSDDEHAEHLSHILRASGITLIGTHENCAMARKRFGDTDQSDEKVGRIAEEAARRAGIEMIHLGMCCLNHEQRFPDYRVSILQFMSPVIDPSLHGIGYRVSGSTSLVRPQHVVAYEVDVLSQVVESHSLTPRHVVID